MSDDAHQANVRASQARQVVSFQDAKARKAQLLREWLHLAIAGVVNAMEFAEIGCGPHDMKAGYAMMDVLKTVIDGATDDDLTVIAHGLREVLR